MIQHKTLVKSITGFSVLVLLLLTIGCTHPLNIKNLNTYSNNNLLPLEKQLSIGMITHTGDVHCSNIIKGIGEALNKYSAQVILPYNYNSSRPVDVVVNISIKPDYKGSGWNFLVNFPGFIVFMPAINGYIYKVDYNVDVTLANASDRKEIDSFNIPVNLDVRHAAINRTWTEVSWLEFGVIALIGGISFTEYDQTVTPLIAEKVKTPLGDYIAQEIITRINNSGKYMDDLNDEVAKGQHAGL